MKNMQKNQSKKHSFLIVEKVRTRPLIELGLIINPKSYSWWQ